jgi:5-methylcytosine-specific restriction endonuclease McrA
MSRLQHHRGRKSNYVKSLGGEYDQEVRRRVLLRDGFRCKKCDSKLYLEKHHIKYYVDGVSIVGCELENDYLKWLVTLCADCHESVHADITSLWNPKNKMANPI